MNLKKFITVCKCIDTEKSARSANMQMTLKQTMKAMLVFLMNNALSRQRDNVITHDSPSPVGVSQFAEVVVFALSLGSVCMAVTSAALNGEINYQWCRLSWHRSQFDHVNQMRGPLDIPVLCNHDLMERIKMNLGHLTVFINYNCHYVMQTINWLRRSYCSSLTLIKVLRCHTHEK